MKLSVVEFKNLLEDRWEESIFWMSTAEVKEYRQILLKELDGKVMPPTSDWPMNVQDIIHSEKIPPGYKSTCKLFVFLVGNGCSPFLAGTWILSYFALCTWKKRESAAKRRIEYLTSIYANIAKTDCEMFYWDVRAQSSIKFKDSVNSYFNKK